MAINVGPLNRPVAIAFGGGPMLMVTFQIRYNDPVAEVRMRLPEFFDPFVVFFDDGTYVLGMFVTNAVGNIGYDATNGVNSVYYNTTDLAVGATQTYTSNGAGVGLNMRYTSAPSDGTLAIYKNGAPLARAQQSTLPAAAPQLSIVCEDQANGTDYYEVYAVHGTQPATFSSRPSQAYFSGQS